MSKPNKSRKDSKAPKVSRPYSAIPASTVHDPRRLALSPNARHVHLVLTVLLAPSGIDVFYAETLPRLTGLTAPACERAVAELVDARWLDTDGTVGWLTDMLDESPVVFVHNDNQRVGIARHVNALPKSLVVDRFRERYRVWFGARAVESSQHPALAGLDDAPVLMLGGSSADRPARRLFASNGEQPTELEKRFMGVQWGFSDEGGVAIRTSRGWVGMDRARYRRELERGGAAGAVTALMDAADAFAAGRGPDWLTAA